jgi:hypothetical protein
MVQAWIQFAIATNVYNGDGILLTGCIGKQQQNPKN